MSEKKSTQSFNLIDEPWIMALYEDGREEKVGLRRLFSEAKQIRCIKTPKYHSHVCHIYVPPVMQFLSVIVMAAFYKPENDFAISNNRTIQKMLQDGLDTTRILHYFDEYHERFDLFSDTHPFLQDISLKEAAQDCDPYAYISNISPLAPKGNNALFGHVSANVEAGSTDYLKHYRTTIEEYAYITLYNASIGLSPMPGQFPTVSLGKLSYIYAIPHGKNLEETIIYNCFPLTDSARPNPEEDIWYDRPAWEIDNMNETMAEIRDDGIDIAKNILLCSFLPCEQMLAVPPKIGEQTIKKIALARQDNPWMNKEVRLAIQRSYTVTNPWAVKDCQIKKAKEKQNTKNNDSIEVKDKETIEIQYKQYWPTNDIQSICMAATKKVGEYSQCRILTNELMENNPNQTLIYYREMDGHKNMVLSCGVHVIPEHAIAVFNSEKNYEYAEKYQKLADNTTEWLKTATNKAGLKGSLIESEYNTWLKHDFFGTFMQSLIDNTNEVISQSCKRMSDWLRSHFAEESKRTTKIPDYVIARTDLYNQLSRRIKKLQKEEANGK